MLHFSEKLLKSIPIPILVLNLDESIEWQNTAFTSAFEPHLESRVLDSSIKSPQRLIDIFRAPDVLEVFRSRMVRIAEPQLNHPPMTTGKISFELKGKVRHYNIETQAIDGKAVFLFHDQTEKRKRKRELEDFLANLSHELRTPITSLLGYTNLIESGMPEQTLQRYKAVLLRNIERIRYFEQSIHAWVDSRRREIRLEHFDIRELIQNLILDFEPFSKSLGSSITLIEEKSALGNFILKSDRGLTMEILQNLMDNALKYSKSKANILIRLSHVAEFGPTWSSAISSKAKRGSKVRILKVDVMDEGPGIPAHLQSRIFERFFRMDFVSKEGTDQQSSETVNAPKGTGLGLNIVKENIKRLGGQIHVIDRKTPTGTTFSVYLPSAE